MTQQLKTLLSGNPELHPLLAQVEALSALQRHFCSVAPTHLAQCCQVLSLKLGTLSVAVANATIAAKLRQLAPQLVIMMQNRACEVSGIRVKVQVSFEINRPRPTQRKLSKTAQHKLNELSLSLADSPLKQALKKMTEQNN